MTRNWIRAGQLAGLLTTSLMASAAALAQAPPAATAPKAGTAPAASTGTAPVAAPVAGTAAPAPVGTGATAPGSAPNTAQLSGDLKTVLGIEDLSIDAKTTGMLQDAVNLFRQGQFDACLDKLRTAASANAELPPARIMLARIFFAINEVPSGRLNLERAAIEAPDAPETHVLFGNLGLAEGRLTDALLHFTVAVPMITNHKSMSPVRSDALLVQCYSGQASVFEQRQDWEAAQGAISVWLKKRPDDPVAHSRAGRVMFFQNRVSEALETLEKAYTLDEAAQKKLDPKAKPRLERAETALGWLYTQNNEQDKARKQMEEAAKKYETDAAVQAAAATWMLNFGYVTEADGYVQKAAALDPEGDALKRLKAMIALTKRDLVAAEAGFRELYNQSPGDFFASNFLALCLIESSDPQKQRQALELAEMNARQYPRNVEALSTVGWVYFKLGALQQAAQVLQAAVQQGQASSDTAYFLAKVMLAGGQSPAQVMPILDSALSASGRFIFRDDAKKLRESLLTIVGAPSQPPAPGGGAPAAGSGAAAPPTTPAPGSGQ